METPVTPPSPSKPKGLPLWTALVALLVLAVVAIGALGAMLYFTTSDNVRLEKESKAAAAEQLRGELATKKAAADALVALARTHQEEVLAYARGATNALGTLLMQATALTTQADALKTNEIGLKVARHPDLVAQARRLYDVSLPKLAPMAEIIARLEGVRRIEQKLVAAAGTSYEPEPDFKVTAQNSTQWAEQELRTVREAQTLLSAIIEDSEIKVVTTPLAEAPPTLVSAIEVLTQAESAERQRSLLAKTEAAQKDVAVLLGDTEAERIRKLGEQEAQSAQALTDAETKRSQEATEREVARIATEAAAAKALADAETEREEARLLREAEAQAAEQEREARIGEAEGRLADSQTEVAALKKESEAQRALLRQKASDPSVQAKLAPFVTPGYKLVTVGISPNLAPLSYRQLQSSGALEPTMAGMRKLVAIANNKKDKARPRWQLGQYWPRDPQKMEQVQEAQSLLTELGPVLVEMGLLAP